MAKPQTDDSEPRINPGRFIYVGVVFEAGLAAVALGLGWLLGVEPLGQVNWTVRAVALGFAATVPLFAFFLILFAAPVAELRRIRELLVVLLGPALAAATWHDLLALSLLVGFSEELLFRGVVQPWLGRWGLLAALVGSNILFGLAHSITPLYAVLAGIMGICLGALLQWPAGGNLLVPMVTHALYDYLAFLVVARVYRRRQRAPREPAA